MEIVHCPSGHFAAQSDARGTTMKGGKGPPGKGGNGGRGTTVPIQTEELPAPPPAVAQRRGFDIIPGEGYEDTYSS